MTVMRSVCVCSDRVPAQVDQEADVCVWKLLDPNRKACASEGTCVGPGAKCRARQISLPVCRLTAERDAKDRLYQWGCDLLWYPWEKAGGTG